MWEITSLNDPKKWTISSKYTRVVVAVGGEKEPLRVLLICQRQLLIKQTQQMVGFHEPSNIIILLSLPSLSSSSCHPYVSRNPFSRFLIAFLETYWAIESFRVENDLHRFSWSFRCSVAWAASLKSPLPITLFRWFSSSTRFRTLSESFSENSSVQKFQHYIPVWGKKRGLFPAESISLFHFSLSTEEPKTS